MKKKVSINLKNVSVNIPIFDVNSRSLRNTFINFKQSRNNKSIIINALKDINIQISEGDRLGVIGNNGSGKTTFLRVCAGAIDTQG